MADACARRHDDAGSAVVHPPAELDVLAVQVDRVIEPAELSEEVGAHQQTGGREDEDVTHAVVLFLVDFAVLDGLIDHAEPVESEPDALQHRRIVPIDELRPDGAGIRAVQLFDQQAHRVRIRRDVVVAEQEEAVLALDEAGHLVGSTRESGVGSQRAHEGVGTGAP